MVPLTNRLYIPSPIRGIAQADINDLPVSFKTDNINNSNDKNKQINN